MRKNGYKIDENDVFQIKPIETDSESEEYLLEEHCIDAVGVRPYTSDEDWD